MKYFIYIIQNKVNNKLYVGITKNIQQRWYTHLSNARYPGSAKHQYIHNAINKYGAEMFSIMEIDSFNDKHKALEAEKFWIEFLQTDINRFGKTYGYNLTAGGEGTWGRKLTSEHKSKISHSLMGNQNSLGIKHSDETKSKMSDVHKGTNNHKARLTEQDILDIRQFHLENINNQDLNIFQHLSEKYNLSISGLEKIIYRKTWKHIM